MFRIRNPLNLFVVVAALTATTLSAAQGNTVQDIDLSPSPSVQVAELIAGSPTGGNIDWNCIRVTLPETGIDVIFANDISGDPDRIEEILFTLWKIYCEAVMNPGGDIGSLRDSGVLGGVEFHLLPNDTTTLPTNDLEVRGRVRDDSGAVIGDMYLFDAAGFSSRVAELETEMGQPLTQVQIFLGHTVQGTDLGLFSVLVAGSSNQIHGPVQADGELKVAGQYNLFNGPVESGSLNLSGSGNQLDDHAIGSPRPMWAPRHDASWYQTEAATASQYFVGDITIGVDANGNPTGPGGVVLSGVVYATGSISVDGDGLVASLTLVAEQHVIFNGDDINLVSATDGVLAYGVNSWSQIDLAGGHGEFLGAFYAPSGKIDVVGWENQVVGILTAQRVRVIGTNNVINNGTK